MIIVLKTGGKNDCTDSVCVKFFKTKDNARQYCEDLNTECADLKYWARAEIIEEGKTYELTREGLYANGF